MAKDKVVEKFRALDQLVVIVSGDAFRLAWL